MVDIPHYYNTCINYCRGEIIAVYYKCKKSSAKIYRLATNRAKTMETPGYNAVPVCTGDKDDVYLEKTIPNSMKKTQLSLQV